MARILWLGRSAEISQNSAGKKGENLDRLVRKNFPVPPGFVVTTESFNEFFSQLNEKISSVLASISYSSEKNVQDKANEIQRIILNAIFPLDTEWGIRSAYDSMDVNVSFGRKTATIMHTKEKASVCVRSSPVSQGTDAPKLATFVNIKGIEQLKAAIKACWASIFTADSILYRKTNSISHNDIQVAVLVQKLVQSDRSGFAYTINPWSGKNEIVIEAVRGFSAGLNEFLPSTYTVDKATNDVKSKDEKEQKQAYFSAEKGRLMLRELPFLSISKPTLDTGEIQKVASIAKDVEAAFNSPTKIEFACENSSVYVIDSNEIKKPEGEMRLEEYEEEPAEEEATEEASEATEEETAEEEPQEQAAEEQTEAEEEQTEEEAAEEEPAEEAPEETEEETAEEEKAEETSETEEVAAEEQAEEEPQEEAAEEQAEAEEKPEVLERDYEQRLNELFDEYSERITSILAELKEEALNIVKK